MSPLCALFVAQPTSVEHSSTYNRSGKHWYFLINVLHRHPGIVYRQRSPSVPCSWPGQHLSNTVRSITELPGRTAFKWWGVWNHQPVVRLFGGDPEGTRNGPAVPSPRGTWWSPPDCLSTSSAALGRCVSRRATTTTGQHRLLTAPGLPSAHAHWRNRASRSPTGGTVPRVRKSGLGLQNLTLVVQLQPQKNTKFAKTIRALTPKTDLGLAPSEGKRKFAIFLALVTFLHRYWVRYCFWLDLTRESRWWHWFLACLIRAQCCRSCRAAGIWWRCRHRESAILLQEPPEKRGLQDPSKGRNRLWKPPEGTESVQSEFWPYRQYLEVEIVTLDTLLGTWAKKIESFQQINSLRVANGNFDSCSLCKRLRTSRSQKFVRSCSTFDVHVRRSMWRRPATSTAKKILHMVVYGSFWLRQILGSRDQCERNSVATDSAVYESKVGASDGLCDVTNSSSQWAPHLAESLWRHSSFSEWTPRWMLPLLSMVKGPE